MEKKVLLILVDGMSPEGMRLSNHPYIKKILEESTYCLTAQTVMPSVTLPCHMSLFHSVTPQRHNTVTNDYTPQVRPVTGLCEQIAKYDGTSAMFYDWEQLRDLTRPGTLSFSYMVSPATEKSLKMTLKEAMNYIPEEKPDFVFFYIGVTDETGHKFGWNSKAYVNSVTTAWDAIEKLLSVTPNEYRVIITADHGGHDRSHGLDIPEDMTIPIVCKGPEFEKGRVLKEANIMDLAPTITNIMNLPANKDWEGKSLI